MASSAKAHAASAWAASTPGAVAVGAAEARKDAVAAEPEDVAAVVGDDLDDLCEDRQGQPGDLVGRVPERAGGELAQVDERDGGVAVAPLVQGEALERRVPRRRDRLPAVSAAADARIPLLRYRSLRS